MPRSRTEVPAPAGVADRRGLGPPGVSPLVAVVVLALPALAAAFAFVWTWGFVVFMHVRRWTYARHADEPMPRRSSLGWLRVWHREVVALLRMQAAHLWLPWSHRPWVPAAPVGPAVVLVHGFTQDGTNWLPLQRHLLAHARTSWAVSLGYPPQPIERYVFALQDRLEAAVRQFGAPVDVVAHSMGGVLLRVALARRPDLVAQVGRVVTIASPHRGTAASRGIRLPETVFLGRRSRTLAELPQLGELLPPDRVTSLGSVDDTTVYPASSTPAGGSTHVELDGLGHAGLLVDTGALAHVARALGEVA